MMQILQQFIQALMGNGDFSFLQGGQEAEASSENAAPDQVASAPEPDAGAVGLADAEFEVAQQMENQAPDAAVVDDPSLFEQAVDMAGSAIDSLTTTFSDAVDGISNFLSPDEPELSTAELAEQEADAIQAELTALDAEDAANSIEAELAELDAQDAAADGVTYVRAEDLGDLCGQPA